MIILLIYIKFYVLSKFRVCSNFRWVKLIFSLRNDLSMHLKWFDESWVNIRQVNDVSADLVLHHGSSEWWSFHDINSSDKNWCGGLSGPMAVIVSEETPRKIYHISFCLIQMWLNFNWILTYRVIRPLYYTRGISWWNTQ